MSGENTIRRHNVAYRSKASLPSWNNLLYADIVAGRKQLGGGPSVPASKPADPTGLGDEADLSAP